ncbi:hypothetical protein HPP92_026619 [Vanilla planifolia]|uniref:Uncharacterized protein n=1 Tax=Vanilla planifolia TaxID=51239 RepID=A0A835U924_VANPL|nr:hypothetical protein HPP92_026619 [Vanilla planifolia]
MNSSGLARGVNRRRSEMIFYSKTTANVDHVPMKAQRRKKVGTSESDGGAGVRCMGERRDTYARRHGS